MSKSTGNYILPMQLINGDNTFFEKAFAPAVIRFCFMQAHYRSVLDISNEAMLAAEKGFNRLMEAIKALNEINTEIEHPTALPISEWREKCYNALLDDFNSPILIAHLFEAVKWIFQVKNGEEKISIDELHELKTLMNAFAFDVLGLRNEEQAAGNNDKLDGVVQLLINMRMEARANKGWALSDKIRDELSAIGIQLKDGKEQLKSYCNATGAPIGVWTNGGQISFYVKTLSLLMGKQRFAFTAFYSFLFIYFLGTKIETF